MVLPASNFGAADFILGALAAALTLGAWLV
jgi:hypothetical protein